MENSHLNPANNIAYLSVNEIKAYQTKNQSLIIPLGGLEPFGSLGALGIPGHCSEIMAHALAVRCDSKVAPIVHYSGSPAFKAFPGCAPVGSNVYENVLINLCKSWMYQGFSRILLLNTGFNPDHSFERTMKRLGSAGNNGVVKLYSWQNDNRIQEMIRSKSSVQSFERCESALLSISSYLNPQLIRSNDDCGLQKSSTKEEYQRWRKRGCDPQKYRKLFKNGLSSEMTAECINPNLGKIFYRYILECMMNDYATYLRAESL